MNIVREIHKKYSYSDISRRIFEATGRTYSPDHLGNVARGSKALSDKLLYNLLRAFPEVLFLNSRSPIGEIPSQESEAAALNS
jgi:hypothetical protein